MWLIERHSEGLKGTRIAVPKLVQDAVIRWYIGDGSAADERVGITLVQQARIGQRWLACDCLGVGQPPPILTPAYLSGAETYYLRRLTAVNRPRHQTDCPFFRDQATIRRHDSETERLSSPPPVGFFEALRPAPEKLARRPDAEAVDDRTRHFTSPRLARLLLRLLSLAGRTSLGPSKATPSISDEFASVRLAATRVAVAPGVELSRVLWTHVDGFHSGRAAAKIKSLLCQWPRGHAPQGFLLLYTRAFHGHNIVVADGPALKIVNRVQSIAMPDNKVSGPYLTLAVLGEYPEIGDIAPLRAFAQPVVSGQCFLPIGDDTERSLIKHLVELQASLARRSVILTIEKPAFDILTPYGECRPDIMVRVAYPSGRIKCVIIQRASSTQCRQRHADSLSALGSVIFYSRIEDASEIINRLCARIA